jgi:hypothetical protein
VQRLLVGLVQRFGKCRHETPTRGIAAELGEIDNTRQSRTGDKPAERSADLGGDWHVGVFAAKHHDRITSRADVGARAQSPPHPERIDDRHPRAAVEQPFDESFGRIGLARPGGADDRDSVIERLKGKRARQRIPAGSE